MILRLPEISLVKENSVIVGKSEEVTKKLDYSTNKTVVRYSKYEFVVMLQHPDISVKVLRIGEFI